MKKLLALLICILMSFSLVACSSNKPGNGGTEPTNAPATNAPSDDPDGNGLTFSNVKVGFVHIGDPSDMGYTFNHDLGTQKMMADLGLSESQVINKFNVAEGSECETALRELVEAGCNIIFATSFGFEPYCLTVAAEYPDVEFCHATGYQAAGSGLPNMHNYFVSIFEARYLAGIAAGLKTQTNKLGYVAAFAFAEPISGFTAFYLGAKSVNPDVTMDVMYVNSWNDPTVEAQVAQALIDGGCDVISQHSDSTAPATTAEANGVWQVGYNADMISAAPKASLISARADWSIYLKYAVSAVVKDEPIDTDWCKGYADGAVYLSPLNTAIAAEGTQSAIDAAAAKIVSGEIHVFDGPLYDKDGNVVVAEGEFFAESAEQSAPSWSAIIQGINELG